MARWATDLPTGHYDVVLGKIKDLGFRWVFLTDITLVPPRATPE